MTKDAEDVMTWREACIKWRAGYRTLKRRYWIVVAVAALGWLLALMAIAELLSLYL